MTNKFGSYWCEGCRVLRAAEVVNGLCKYCRAGMATDAAERDKE